MRYFDVAAMKKFRCVCPGMGNALVDIMTELPDDRLLEEFDLRKVITDNVFR